MCTECLPYRLHPRFFAQKLRDEYTTTRFPEEDRLSSSCQLRPKLLYVCNGQESIFTTALICHVSCVQRGDSYESSSFTMGIVNQLSRLSLRLIVDKRGPILEDSRGDVTSAMAWNSEIS